MDDQQPSSPADWIVPASGSAAFGGLEAAVSDIASARALIIPVPYDATTTYITGTRQGPAAILEASQQLEFFDEETRHEVFKVGIATLEEIEVDARGPGSMVARVETVGRWALDTGLFPLMLGGEHLLSLGMIRAVAEESADLTILHLDAHADLRRTYQGSDYSNACVMRLAGRHGNVVSVGIRSLSLEEDHWIRQQGLTVFYAADLRDNSRWQQQVVDCLGQEVYITIDLDVFDPAEMPAVGTPEPGGLHWYEVLKLLRLVCENRTVIGADVMELCPQAAHSPANFTAAKLVYKILAYRFHGEISENSPA
ncbi:MAG: agmatinase [Deltaproteobacteria bacterium]|nr:agmatinase [Deltaproteobacteria bacterium]